MVSDELLRIDVAMRDVATHLQAEMARAGLHDLSPYDDPEFGWINPLDDTEVQVAVRRFLAHLRRWCSRERDGGDGRFLISEGQAVVGGEIGTLEQIPRSGWDDGIVSNLTSNEHPSGTDPIYRVVKV